MNTKIYLILIAIIIISFAGCERVKQVVTSDALNTDTVSTVKIGVIQPSGYYTSFVQGAELARTQINSGGGILGMPIEFIVMDNQGERSVPDPAESVRIAKTLIEEEDVGAILGPIFSTNSMQVGPIAQQLQRPLIPGSAGENVTAAGDFVFLVVPPTPVQAAVMAQFAVDPSELGAMTAATFREVDSVYSENLARAFEESFQKLGGEIVAAEVYQYGDTTFDAQLTNIKAAAPDVLFLATGTSEVSLVSVQAREMGIEAIFIGGDSWDEPEKLLGTLDDNTSLENAYFTTNFNPELPHAALFVETYTALFMTPLDGMAASGYDAMSLLAIAIEKAQTLNPTSVRDALSNTTNYEGATLISHYDVNRHPVKSVVINRIRNGEIELYKVVER